MSKFIDLLRKLGIFRSGSVSGTYTNAINRPTEFQMEGVYDAKKDLVNKDDIVKAKAVIAKSSKGGLMAKLLLLVAIIFGLFFTLGIFSGGFTVWAIVLIALWLFVIWKFWRAVSMGGLGLIGMIVYLIVTVIVSFVIFAIAHPTTAKDSSSSNSSGNSTGTLTDANFDTKVLNITSADGSVAGTIGLTKKTNKAGKKYLSAAYNILIKTDVPLNSKCGTPGFIMGSNCTKGYEYADRLVPVQESGTKTSNGTVVPVYCSDYKLAEPYNIAGTGNTAMGCIKGSTDDIKVSTFVANFQTNYYSYAEIFKTIKFEIYDRSDFWEPTPGVVGSFIGNNDKAVQETSPVKTLQFVVTE